MDDDAVDRSQLPGWFVTSLTVAVTAQLLTCAWAVDQQDARGLVVLGAGLLVLLAVGALGATRLRGVPTTTLLTRVVLGSTSAASSAYVLALGAATWAVLADRWWWALAAAAVGGRACASAGGRWWRDHADRPEHGGGPTWQVLGLLGAAGVAGAVALVVVG